MTSGAGGPADALSVRVMSGGGSRSGRAGCAGSRASRPPGPPTREGLRVLPSYPPRPPPGRATLRGLQPRARRAAPPTRDLPLTLGVKGISPCANPSRRRAPSPPLDPPLRTPFAPFDPAGVNRGAEPERLQTRRSRTVLHCTRCCLQGRSESQHRKGPRRHADGPRPARPRSHHAAIGRSDPQPHGRSAPLVDLDGPGGGRPGKGRAGEWRMRARRRSSSRRMGEAEPSRRWRPMARATAILRAAAAAAAAA